MIGATVKSVGVATMGVYPGYTGSLTVQGPVAVAGIFDYLTLSWYLRGIETDECATVPVGVSNACGVHIHEGTSCDDASLVGGHFYDKDQIESDPWSPVAATAKGNYSYGAVAIKTGKTTQDVQGRAMVVHDHTGARVACGLIGSAPLASQIPITFAAYPGYAGDLQVTGYSAAYTVFGTAFVSFDIHGVEDACSSTPEGVGNACGIHIHEGKSCDDATLVGGHFYDKTKVESDPWGSKVYTSKDGIARGLFPVRIGSDDIAGRAMVVHDSTGARIACGLLPASFVV